MISGDWRDELKLKDFLTSRILFGWYLAKGDLRVVIDDAVL